MSNRLRTSPPVHAGILFLRFLAAHLLCLGVGIALSLFTLPLWTGLLRRLQDTDPAAPLPWAWYLLTLAPFYAVLSTLTILVVYLMWTGASNKMKTRRHVLRVTAWIHLLILLSLNLIVGRRMLP